MAKSMQMDNIDFVTAETDQESCSGTGLDSEKEIDNSNIDYLSDNESQIQFVHSQQVQCTTNDNDDDDGMSNVNKANVNHDNNAELVLVDSGKNDKFENNDDDQIWGHQSLTVHLKARNKESEVLIVVVTVTMMKKKQHHNTVMDMLLLTIVLAVDVLRLVVDQSIDRVYIEEVECVLGVVVAEFLCVVQYWLAEEEEVMLQVEMLGHRNK